MMSPRPPYSQPSYSHTYYTVPPTVSLAPYAQIPPTTTTHVPSSITHQSPSSLPPPPPPHPHHAIQNRLPRLPFPNISSDRSSNETYDRAAVHSSQNTTRYSRPNHASQTFEQRQAGAQEDYRSSHHGLGGSDQPSYHPNWTQAQYSYPSGSYAPSITRYAYSTPSTQVSLENAHATIPRYTENPSVSSVSDPRRNSSISALPSPTYTTSLKRTREETPEQSAQALKDEARTIAESSSNARIAESSISRSAEKYQLIVRQQPMAARACGFGERDRRVIDPPPIVQLFVRDSETGQQDKSEMRYSFHVVHCTLWNVDGNVDETALIGMDRRLTRRLMGTLVSSPFVGKDENGEEGCFFCFPDLSCRTHGRYRLRFVLMRLDPSDLRPGGQSPTISYVLSDIFTVYTAKEFPGMRPSTGLTKALKRQGCAISVKKGNEKNLGPSDFASLKEDNDGSEDESTNESGPKPKRRRKAASSSSLPDSQKVLAINLNAWAQQNPRN